MIAVDWVILSEAVLAMVVNILIGSLCFILGIRYVIVRRRGQ